MRLGLVKFSNKDYDAKIGTDLSCERAWAESSTSLEKLASAAAECRADVQDASRGRAKKQREKSAVGASAICVGTRWAALGLGVLNEARRSGRFVSGAWCLSATEARASQATGTSCTLG
jgi:hypothetical protein